MKNLLLTLLAWVCISAYNAEAITVNLGLDEVQNSTGGLVSTGTLALLVIDTDGNGFTTPGANASAALNSYIVPGDDYISWVGDFSGGSTGVFYGALSFSIGSVDIPTNANFAIYWFPTLTTADTTIAGGTSYGYYTSSNATQFGSDSAWNTGASDSAILNINAFTVDNTGTLTTNPLVGGLPDTSLKATLTTVPEPATWALLTAGLTTVTIFRRRRRI